MAILYNDISPLENHHASKGFSILLGSPNNDFTNSCLDSEEYIYFRKMVIQLVLCTDLKEHFKLVEAFKTKTLNEEWNFDEFEDRLTAAGICIKCADISHSSKDFEQHISWSRRVTEEFFFQGDVEREYDLPVSPLCDKGTVNVPKNQVGFINFLCMPLFEVWTNFLQNPDATGIIIKQ